MKICIDARWIGEKIAGIGRYTVYLLKYLAEIDRRNRYLVLFHKEPVMKRVCDELGLQDRAGWEAGLLPYDVFSLRGQWELPRFLRREAVDLYHSTNFMGPLAGFSGKMALTIHDIIPLKFPEYAPRSRKSRLFPIYKLLMKRLVSGAGLIIADSEHSRRDIMEFLGVPPGKVRTVYLGVDEKYRPLGEDVRNRVREELRIKGKLAVYAGRADPYKNLISLLKAVRRLNDKGTVRFSIAVAGEKDARYPETGEYIREARMDADVIFMGSLGEDRLIPLYNAADVLVLPSLYEGFGLPPLEAMACGTPVVCSDQASLPEVVGDAALLIDPLDIGAIADAMERVSLDGDLRRELIDRGLKRAKLFPWRKTAERTLELYESRATGDGRRETET